MTVVYPVSNPRQARIDGGTRTYSQKAMTYILEVTFGAAALVAFVTGRCCNCPTNCSDDSCVPVPGRR